MMNTKFRILLTSMERKRGNRIGQLHSRQLYMGCFSSLKYMSKYGGKILRFEKTWQLIHGHP
jgi:hypothetical protein